MEINEATSIKELLQGMAPKSMEVIRGRVTRAAPLEIVAANDEKLVLNANTAVVPRHLTDYSAECDIELGGGAIISRTRAGGEHPHGTSGEHPHGTGGGHGGHCGGDGLHSHPPSEGGHSHPPSEGAHVHGLDGFCIYRATIRHYNALKVGETVIILSFNSGKKYLVLDREAG